MKRKLQRWPGKPRRFQRNVCQAERTSWQILPLQERDYGNSLLTLGTFPAASLKKSLMKYFTFNHFLLWYIDDFSLFKHLFQLVVNLFQYFQKSVWQVHCIHHASQPSDHFSPSLCVSSVAGGAWQWPGRRASSQLNWTMTQFSGRTFLLRVWISRWG